MGEVVRRAAHRPKTRCEQCIIKRKKCPPNCPTLAAEPMALMPLSAGGEPSSAQASSAPTRRVSSRGKAPRNAYPESLELRERATGKRRLELGVGLEEEEEVEEEEGGEGEEDGEDDGEEVEEGSSAEGGAGEGSAGEGGHKVGRFELEEEEEVDKGGEGEGEGEGESEGESEGEGESEAPSVDDEAAAEEMERLLSMLRVRRLGLGHNYRSLISG